MSLFKIFFPCGIFPFSAASNISPLASAIGRMQINRRHTLAAEPQMNSPRTRALNSNLSVLISPLQNKRRHTLTTAALLNSARKAVDQAHRIAEQNKKKSIGHIEEPRQSGAVREGPEKRTPLKPLNPRALRNNDERAASTPEGNIYLYRFLEYTIFMRDLAPGFTCQKVGRDSAISLHIYLSTRWCFIRWIALSSF